MGDLIDRNAAIQICNDAENFWEGLSGVTGIHSVRSEISKLPSVPSEIIRCKDCMHNGSFDTDCPIDWNGKEYCSFAERKEDE